MSKVVVLGSGFAGANTALRAAARGLDVEVVDRNGYHTYVPGLVDLFRDRVPEEKNRKNLNDLYRGTGVDFSREVVERVDPRSRRIHTNAGEREYSSLVVALGSEPRKFGIDTGELENPYTLEGVRSSLGRLDEAESVAVVGSGYVGVEIAGELAEAGKEVTVVDAATRPMPNGSEAASHTVLNYFNSMDIRFRGGKPVVDYTDGKLELEDGERLGYDMVFWAPGIQASSVVQESFDAEPAGLDVNKQLEARNFTDVYAVGDSAQTGALDTAHNAMKQARTVAANLDGGGAEYSESRYPLVVSLGATAMMTYGSSAFSSRFLRRLKDRIRDYYWLTLRKNRLRALAAARSR